MGEDYIYDDYADYCRMWARSDGFIHCSDCIFYLDCPNVSKSDTYEYCENFVVSG